MTARRLIALVVAAGCSALLLIGCSRSSDSPEVARLRRQGKTLYKRFACGSCHGEDRLGKRTAPPLTGLTAHWDEPSLAAYLSDPATFSAANPRLRYLSENYIADMPRPRGATEAEIATVAAYMLIEPE